jgi:hypothetical protein
MQKPLLKIGKYYLRYSNHNFMLKPFIATLLTLGIYTATLAQTKGTTEFGVNVGLNATNVENNNGNNHASHDYRIGLNVGVSADYYISDQWSIKAKLIYDQKGWNHTLILLGNNYYPSNFKFNYLTIPIMANLHFGKTRNWYLNLGPYMGILLNAKTTTNNIDLTNYINGPEAGLAAGIGLKFPIAGRSKFFIEYLGQGGVFDISKKNLVSYYNISGSLNVGINF